MTHDELLDKIYWHWRKDARGDGLQPMIDYRRALLEVVRLHKPFMYEGRFGQFERCSGCASEEEWLGEIYPCLTVKAIEKELLL